jgi:hypothetical protein
VTEPADPGAKTSVALITTPGKVTRMAAAPIPITTIAAITVYRGTAEIFATTPPSVIERTRIVDAHVVIEGRTIVAIIVAAKANDAVRATGN